MDGLTPSSSSYPGWRKGRRYTKRTLRKGGCERKKANTDIQTHKHTHTRTHVYMHTHTHTHARTHRVVRSGHVTFNTHGMFVASRNFCSQDSLVPSGCHHEAVFSDNVWRKQLSTFLANTIRMSDAHVNAFQICFLCTAVGDCRICPWSFVSPWRGMSSVVTTICRQCVTRSWCQRRGIDSDFWLDSILNIYPL